MANPTFAELVAAPVSRSHPLAIVKQDCIVIRDAAQRSYTIISLFQLSGMKRVTTTYPALIVISCGVLLIAAAAFCSKQGSGAGIPLAVLGACFGIGYFLTRRAALVFIAGSAHFETASGSLSEVAALVASVQLARDELFEESERTRPVLWRDHMAGGSCEMGNSVARAILPQQDTPKADRL